MSWFGRSRSGFITGSPVYGRMVGRMTSFEGDDWEQHRRQLLAERPREKPRVRRAPGWFWRLFRRWWR